MNQARKIEAKRQGAEQKDLIRFNEWLQTEGLYDLAATLVAASEMVAPKKEDRQKPKMVVIHRTQVRIHS